MVEKVSSPQRQRYYEWFGQLPETALAQDLSQLGLFARQFCKEMYSFTGEAARQLESLFSGVPHSVFQLLNQVLELQAAGALRQKFGKPQLVEAEVVAVALTDTTEEEAHTLASMRREMQVWYEYCQQVLAQVLLTKTQEMAVVQAQLVDNKRAIQDSSRPDNPLARAEYTNLATRTTAVNLQLSQRLVRLQVEVATLQKTMSRILGPLGLTLQQMVYELTVRPLDESKAISLRQLAQPA